MSSKKKAEGIALLSLYNDEDMDVDEDMEEDENADEDNSPVLSSPSPQASVAFEKNPSKSPSPAITSPVEAQRPSKGGLGIVDYAHDETAVSPEPEEGEIVSTGAAVFGQEPQAGNGDPTEKTPPAMGQHLTPGKTSTSQPGLLAEALAKPESDTQSLDSATTKEPEIEASSEFNGLAKMELQQPDQDPLADFLPPPPTSKCSEELQNKINRYLMLKNAGRSFNEELRNSKGYRNPDFLQRAVKYQEIDQIGSCFRKDIFDPHGYDPSDYYDALALELKRELERREQEKKKSQRVDFVHGVQPASVQPVPKPVVQVLGGQKTTAGVMAASTNVSLQTATSATDNTKIDNRNKKSKWDKVDGDRKNPLPPGAQDAMAAATAHAALLTSANAGAGYTAFAQQKRKEAEEKRSHERRVERRS
ncbi:uncharacterized protein LOC131071204 isoform X1 [Cryptomeria japonica]|uniref:uncharacterized protein LOC131071204 isoform X1 n=1 Tax=Cryptomeria japonica TaxID=3369 RepID=UPI0027DA01DC|nr:uncharacterized protein LOC131071204 isoform X1 [Cryptomeria japonica]